ncbi:MULTISPECIES: hypothetical protein [Bacillus]|uniref:hypothetical protein n=1 Tax=Bacillus TaxID=1386 RepID=UPI000BF40208|nr:MULTISPECIES: hypothetical protein [Bacillus]MDK3010870.1 hypothetical protein [Bacillus sp. RB3]MDZ4444512.1 hypothetical protein [Bacillus cereus]PFT33228.1 hypothetical protein COK71_16490 [Bacillus cereus]
MSLVSVVAHELFITVVSDGLAVTTYGDGRVVRNEECPKFHMISPKQFVAYTGVKEISDEVLAGYPNRIEEYNLGILKEELKERVNSFSYENGNRIAMVVGGVCNNEIVAYSFNNDPMVRDISLNTEDGNMPFVVLQSPLVEEDLTNKLFEMLSSEVITHPNDVLRIQREFTEYVDGIDESVNGNTYESLIVKTP